MTAASKPLSEITSQAIRVLCREIGAVNTARFLNQFSTGSGDYTKDRDAWIGDPTVEELLSEMKQAKAKPHKSKGVSTRKRR